MVKNECDPTSSRRVGFVIVAGGRGARMHSELPKQYIELCGKPILMHTLRHALVILSSADRVVLVVPATDITMVAAMVERYVPEARGRDVVICAGGASRTESVQHGLEAVGKVACIAIHDGVRCFFSATLLRQLIDSAMAGNIGLPVQPATDSILSAPAGGTPTYLRREELFQVKTPQIFAAPLIRAAYEAYETDLSSGRTMTFTDDASLVQYYHPEIAIQLIQMEGISLKVTHPEDLAAAEHALRIFDPLA